MSVEPIATAAENSTHMHLKAILATLPNQAGVYKMYSSSQELLYIGKAKNLKNRVSSYFVKTIDHPKTRALVARIAHIETLLTRSETEALLLEQNLIKQYKPPYNILLRDDKSYLYVYISADQPYPRLASGRGKRNHQQGKFFGPFPSSASAKETLVLLQKMFMLRQCDNHFFAQRTRPCLEYQIKRCRAPCVGLVSPEDYARDVESTIRFLKGENTELNQKLIGMMEAASAEFAFEQAAVYRDQLMMLRDIQAQQSVYTERGEADILAVAQQAGVVCVQVMNVRGGRMLGGKSFFPDLPVNDDAGLLLSEFMASFYFQVADDLPAELIISHVLPDQPAMQEALATHYGKKVLIKHRVRENRAEWLELAQLNAQAALKSKLGNQLEILHRFELLQGILKQPIDRIECFDISHTMGEAPIASCVVFDQGGARKRDYRQYAIEDITGGDDYAAMRQVLTRRYSKQPLPDLILIDGGKGQLSSAMAVMAELGLFAPLVRQDCQTQGETVEASHTVVPPPNGVEVRRGGKAKSSQGAPKTPLPNLPLKGEGVSPVAAGVILLGVSKGEGRKAGLETLHFVDGTTLNLANDHKALHLIQQIRDEAHRFAITKHRAKRDKRRAGSVLELIPNLGEKRRRELLAHFGGLQALLGAGEAEIAEVKGIGQGLARQIYAVLHE